MNALRLTVSLSTGLVMLGGCGGSQPLIGMPGRCRKAAQSLRTRPN